MAEQPSTTHTIIDIVPVIGGPFDFSFDPADIAKGCLDCRDAEPGERPAGECPADRWNLMASFGRALGRLQAARC